jgi:hypothetical protein
MRSALSGDVLFTSSAFNTDQTGSWIALNGKPVPADGLPIGIFLRGGSTSGSAGSAKVTIQDSADGSTVGNVLFEKTFVLAVAAAASDFDEIYRIFTRQGYVRVVIDLTGTIDADLVGWVGVMTGDVP